MILKDQIKNNLIDSRLISRNNKLLVGVSGGPDSVALIHLLNSLRYELGLNLKIAHYNHKLRKSSDKDQQFVERLAKNFNIPLEVKSSKKLNKLQKGSIEEACRTERFNFFHKTAKSFKTNIIVLAHTQDDLAETVLMRILKGSGLYGLRAIMPVRKIDHNWFIRPLLNASKEDVLNYLKSNKLKFCIDPTNKHLHFFRNKIRLELLPLLKKEYNLNINKVLSSLSESATEDYEYINVQAQKEFALLAVKDKKTVTLKLNKFVVVHPSIQNELLRQSLELVTGTLRRFNYEHIQMIMRIIHANIKSTSVVLPNSIKIIKINNLLKIIRNNKS